MLSRYEAVLAGLRAGVVIHAADSTILEANTHARKLLGIQDLEGRLATDPDWVFLEADGSPMVLDRFPVMQAIATAEPVRDLSMIIKPPGRPDTWLDVNAVPVFDDDGALQYVTVTFIDVTAEKEAERALADQAERLTLVLASSRLGLWDWNMVTGETVYDDRWAEIAGYTLAELAPVSVETWLKLANADDLTGSNALIQAHAEGLTPYYDVELRMRHKQGHWVWVHDRGRIVEWTADGRPLRMTGTHEDITERREIEAAILASRAQLELAEHVAHVGRWQVNPQTGTARWSGELLEIFRLDPTAEVPDFPHQQQFFAPASWVRLQSAVSRTAETGAPFVLDVEIVRADGSHGWMEAHGEAVRDLDGAVTEVHGLWLDITDRKAASDQLTEMATHDALTGLANRASVLEQITRAATEAHRSGRWVAVLLLDLDRFKHINDTLGHTAGDDLLIAAAARLVGLVRAGDFTGRLGGDEFVVVMRHVLDPREALRAAERLVREFRAPFTTEAGELFSTASVGVAISQDEVNAGDLLREADTAMYAAKEGGRDRVSMFNETLRSAAANRLAVETDLRRALERDQLEVWYQPEVDLVSGSVIGFEGLLRWHHPSGEVWAADRFVRVAEDAGLIHDVGRRVFTQVCHQAARWAAARPDRSIAWRINVSALQLAEPSLLADLDEALATSGVDPHTLCVEITETALLHRTATVAENITGIRSRGLSLAIDDFGTGYASLTNLDIHPIDVIKIDASFMTDPQTPQPDRRLLTAIVGLAQTLGLATVAEGVEYPEQAAHLRQIGCVSAQGWLFSRAVPPREIASVLDRVYPQT